MPQGKKAIVVIEKYLQLGDKVTTHQKPGKKYNTVGLYLYVFVFQKLLEIFSDYAFLWLQDVNNTFDEFLRGKLTPNPLRSPHRNMAGGIRHMAAERTKSRSDSRYDSTTYLLLSN